MIQKPGYTAIVPDLAGCVTCGDTIQDVFEMAVDAASGWVLTELEDGNPVPKASIFKEVHANEYPDGFVSYADFRYGYLCRKIRRKSRPKELHHSCLVKYACRKESC